MKYKIVTMLPGSDIKEQAEFQNACAVLEENITKENLVVNGGTLNYNGLTYESDILLVAVSDEKPVGYVSLVLVQDSLYVYQIAVKDEYKHKGIGTALVSKTIAIANNLGLGVQANIRDYNTYSKEMFTKLGFTKLGYSTPGDGYYQLSQKSKNHPGK